MKVNFESVVFNYRKNLLHKLSNYVALKVGGILEEVEQQVRVETSKQDKTIIQMQRS